MCLASLANRRLVTAIRVYKRKLLPYTKVAEYLVQQIFSHRLARNLTEGVERDAQIDRYEGGGRSQARPIQCRLQVLLSPFERVTVAHARYYGVSGPGGGLPAQDKLSQFLFKLVRPTTLSGRCFYGLKPS